MYGQKRPLLREQPHGVAIEDVPEKPNAPKCFESWDARRTAIPAKFGQSQGRIRIRVIWFAGLREGEIRGPMVGRRRWRRSEHPAFGLEDSLERRDHDPEDDDDPGVVPSFRSSSLFDLCSMRSSPRMHLTGCSQIESAVSWIWANFAHVVISPGSMQQAMRGQTQPAYPPTL